LCQLGQNTVRHDTLPDPNSALQISVPKFVRPAEFVEILSSEARVPDGLKRKCFRHVPANRASDRFSDISRRPVDSRNLLSPTPSRIRARIEIRILRPTLAGVGPSANQIGGSPATSSLHKFSGRAPIADAWVFFEATAVFLQRLPPSCRTSGPRMRFREKPLLAAAPPITAGPYGLLTACLTHAPGI